MAPACATRGSDIPTPFLLLLVMSSSCSCWNHRKLRFHLGDYSASACSRSCGDHPWAQEAWHEGQVFCATCPQAAPMAG